MDTVPQVHWMDPWPSREFEAARQRHTHTFYGGCKGPCDQGDKPCGMPEVCFASAPSPTDPVSAPSARSWLQKVMQKLRAWWHRHVVDHNVWE